MGKNKLQTIILLIIAIAVIFTGIQLNELNKTMKAGQTSEDGTPENLKEYKMASKDELLIPEIDFSLEDLMEGDEKGLEISRSFRGKELQAMDIVQYSTKKEANLTDNLDGQRKIIINGSLSCGACLEYLDSLHELIGFIDGNAKVYFLVPESDIGTELEVEIRNRPQAVKDSIYIVEIGKDITEDEYYQYGTPLTKFVNGNNEVETAFNGWMAVSYWEYTYLVSLEKRMPFEGEIEY